MFIKRKTYDELVEKNDELLDYLNEQEKKINALQENIAELSVLNKTLIEANNTLLQQVETFEAEKKKRSENARRAANIRHGKVEQ